MSQQISSLKEKPASGMLSFNDGNDINSYTCTLSLTCPNWDFIGSYTVVMYCMPCKLECGSCLASDNGR